MKKESECLSAQTTITMLGTGNALVTKCFNTCFLLRSPKSLLLVDTGGGNGILSQLEKTGVNATDINHLFITHAHTDHIMGAIWLMRKVINSSKDNGYEGTLTIYGHERVLNVLGTMAKLMLSKRDYAFVGKQILFNEVHDGEHIELPDVELQCFDIHSEKEKQYGFRAKLPDGQILVCLGDEPYQEQCHDYVAGTDWLMCEAFCLYSDKDRFHPYEKFHSTVKDAAQLANTLGVKNLVLYHTEDATLTIRQASYMTEARKYYAGNVVVPNDLDVIKL